MRNTDVPKLCGGSHPAASTHPAVHLPTGQHDAREISLASGTCERLFGPYLPTSTRVCGATVAARANANRAGAST